MAPKRILLVDDEVLVALDAEDVLVGAGYDVVGPAHHFDAAFDLASHAPLDAAVLDVNLAGTLVWPVAEALIEREIPFVLLTGFGRGLDVPPSCKRAPFLGKPLVSGELVDALDTIFTRVR